MLTLAREVTVSSTLQLPFTVASVAAARQALRRELAGTDVTPACAEDALLVLSELVSNALRHARPLAGGHVRVRWRVAGAAVEIEVTDGGSPTHPHASAAPMSATGGRGLGIVQQLSHDWGVRQDSGRTSVWALVAGRRAVTLRAAGR